MYFILAIEIDDAGRHARHEIIDHTQPPHKVANALLKLEANAKKFVKEEGGNQMSMGTKVIDIKNFEQVCEPLTDTLLIYRLETDPHHLHVYQRKTKIVPGVLYGQSLVAEFRKIKIFSILEYEKLNLSAREAPEPAGPSMDTEFVPVGTAGIKIPKQMTISPMCDVINQLKQSPKFKQRIEMEKRHESFLGGSHDSIFQQELKNSGVPSNDEVLRAELKKRRRANDSDDE